MTISLSNLIEMICCGDFVSEQLVYQHIQEEYKLPLTTEEGVERFLWENDLDTAIDRLVDSWRAIGAMAKEVDPSCPDKPERTDAIQRLLQGLGLALSTGERAPLGATAIAKRLSELRDNISDLESWGRVNFDDLRRLPLDGWSYIERVLKSTVTFYASILFDSNKLVNESFKNAKKKKSLGPIFGAMKSIEDEFATASSDLVEQSLRLYGRPSPFAGFRFKDYDNKVVDIYRNFYAHNIPEVIEIRNVSPIKEAIEITLKLVTELIDLEIAPSVIYITAHGWDEYMRGFLWFVNERHITLRPQQRRKVELQMFKRNPGDFHHLKPYLTVPRTRDKMFDPPIVPLNMDRQGVLLDDAV